MEIFKEADKWISDATRNGGRMNEVERVKEVILSHKEWLEECLAIGLFGSLARGDFRRGSDIDMFIIVEDDKWTKDIALWHIWSIYGKENKGSHFPAYKICTKDKAKWSIKLAERSLERVTAFTKK